MATTTLTLTVEHGDATPDAIVAAVPAILREVADNLDHESGAAGLRLQVPNDRSRVRLTGHELANVTGVRAAWTAVTK